MTHAHYSNRTDTLRYRLPRELLGLILLATGLGKALDIQGFIDVLTAYQLFPEWGNVMLAYTLPFIELATGYGLLTATRLRTAAYAAVVLHLLLLSAAAITMWRGIHLENCGCFGVFLARPLSMQTLVEDGVLLLLSIYILISCHRVVHENTDNEG